MASGISQAQKQALIDNLQLEVTERARKLRAQYALQAQGLRSRLEMRVNRIPQALRKRNMQDLIDEQAEKAKPAPPPSFTAMSKTQKTTQPSVAPVISVKGPAKRKSDDISTADDKENVPSNPNKTLANPKKRAKAATSTATSKAVPTASRKVAPGGVLSPKSHNSRTLPRSPVKTAGTSPEKPLPARSVQSVSSVNAKSASRTSRTTRKPAANTENEGRNSEASTASSAGTTIVTKPSTKRAGTVTKKTAPAKAPSATAGRKPATSKNETAGTTTGGRTLRKRT